MFCTLGDLPNKNNLAIKKETIMGLLFNNYVRYDVITVITVFKIYWRLKADRA